MSPSEKYRIVERLGNQHTRKFSDVFLAENKQTGERVTLKVLVRSAANAGLQERLEQEATFDFDHPQLPKTRDLFVSETELMLVRTYTPGVPLDAFLQTVRQKEKPAVLLRFVQQLQPVFAELERRHVVHLDLKPSNFILDGTPENFTVSLIDFGMALRTDRPEKRATLFPLGYAAPELLLNRLHLVDRRTDLFALGIVLWQQLAGKLPLLHPNPGITTNLQLTHPLPEHDRIPKRLFDILRKLSAKHAFGLPPNRLPEEEMDALLRSGMAARYERLEDVCSDWEAALTARRKRFGWF